MSILPCFKTAEGWVKTQTLCYILQLECELEGMRAEYDELQISSRRRENLEWSARRKMDTEIERLQENNKQLQGKNILSFKKKK